MGSASTVDYTSSESSFHFFKLIWSVEIFEQIGKKFQTQSGTVMNYFELETSPLFLGQIFQNNFASSKMRKYLDYYYTRHRVLTIKRWKKI